MQRYAVWFGGSLIGASAEFSKNVKTKAGKLICFKRFLNTKPDYRLRIF